MEDTLWWKTTFDGRQPSTKDKLRWRTAFGGIRPLADDDLWRKTPFGERQPLVEDYLWWKTTFGGRQPLMEDDHRWKTTFGGRGPLVEDGLGGFGGRWPGWLIRIVAGFLTDRDLIVQLQQAVTTRRWPTGYEVRFVYFSNINQWCWVHKP